MKKQILIAVGIVGGFILLLGLFKFIQISNAIAQSKNFQPPPEAVTTQPATEAVWQETLEAVGSLTAVQGVTLSAQEPGKVVKVNFESGQKVEAGTVLVALDTVVEEANLRGAIALRDQATRDYERAKALRQRNANSQSDLDSANAKLLETEAAVQSLQGTIERKRIIAPFSGRAGIRMVNVGQYLTPGSNVVPLFALDPLYVNFSLPQQAAIDLYPGHPIKLKVDALPEQEIQGELTAVNPQIDTSSRNVELQATISNANEKLKPGMFARVWILLPKEDKVIAIPASSINHAPYGDSVYIVEQMKAQNGSEFLGVRQQFVKLGAKRGDQVAIASGLKVGETVVTSGVFKLRPNAAVMVNNDFTPGNDTNPTPADT